MKHSENPSPEVTVSLNTWNELICQRPESILKFLQENHEAAQELYRDAVSQLRNHVLSNQDISQWTCLYYDQRMPEIPLESIHTDIITRIFSEKVSSDITPRTITDAISHTTFEVISGRKRVMQEPQRLLLQALRAFCAWGTTTDINKILRLSEYTSPTEQEQRKLKIELQENAKILKDYERLDDVEDRLSDMPDLVKARSLLDFINKKFPLLDKNDIFDAYKRIANVPESNIWISLEVFINNPALKKDDKNVTVEIAKIAVNVPGSNIWWALSTAIRIQLLTYEDKHIFTEILKTAVNVPGSNMWTAVSNAIHFRMITQKEADNISKGS